MTFYHGSSVGGLTELRPYAKPWSNLKQPLVYMTSSKQLAIHYNWNTEKYEINIRNIGKKLRSCTKMACYKARGE